MTKKIWFQILALILSVSLPCSQLFGALPDPSFSPKVSPRFLAENIQIPAKLGSVVETFQGSSNHIVIHLEDAHGQISIQENLGAIVKYLYENYAASALLLEGAEGALPMKEARTFEDRTARETVSRAFLRRFEMTGPEFFIISENPGMEVYGLEDQAHYYDNRFAYFQARRMIKKLLPAVSKLERTVQNIQREIYNPDLLNLVELKRRAETQSAFLPDYLAELKSAYVRGKNANESEFTNRFPIVAMFQAGDKRTAAVPPGVFKKSQAMLERAARRAWIQTRAEAKLEYVSSLTDQLRKICTLAFTSGEYRLFVKHREKLTAAFMKREFASIGKAGRWRDEFEEPFLALPAFRAFYDGAEARDAEMAKQLDLIFQKRNTEAAISVAGGFHTRGLTSALRAMGYSYVVIRPKAETIRERSMVKYHDMAWTDFTRLIQAAYIAELEPIGSLGGTERYQRLLSALAAEHGRIQNQERAYGPPLSGAAAGFDSGPRTAGFGVIIDFIKGMGASAIRNFKRQKNSVKLILTGLTLAGFFSIGFPIVSYFIRREQPMVYVAPGEEQALQFEQYQEILAKSESLQEKAFAIEMIGKSGDERAVETLKAWLHDPALAWRAARALLETKDERLEGVFIELFNAADWKSDEGKESKRIAVWALGEIGTPSIAVDFLINTFSNETDDYGAHAGQKRDATQSVEAGPILEELLLLEHGSKLTDVIIDRLVKIGRSDYYLSELIRDHADTERREALIEVLGRLAAAESVDTLFDLYTEYDGRIFPDWSTHKAIHAALESIVKRTADLDTLSRILNRSQKIDISVLTATRLGVIKDPRAAGPLLEAMTHADVRVRDAAYASLVKVNDMLAQLDRSGKHPAESFGEADWAKIRSDVSQAVNAGAPGPIHRLFLRPYSYVSWIVSVLLGFSLFWLAYSTVVAVLRFTAQTFKSVFLLKVVRRLSFYTGNYELVRGYIEALGSMRGDQRARNELVLSLDYMVNGFHSTAARRGFSPFKRLSDKEEAEVSAQVVESLRSVLGQSPELVTKEFVESIIHILKDARLLTYWELIVSALSAAKEINPAAFTKENVVLLLESAHDFSVSMEILGRFSDVIPETYVEAETLKKLAAQIETEVGQRPAGDQALYRKTLIQSINAYREQFITDKSTDEYAEITSLLRVVHDNLPVVLNSFRSMKRRATEFAQLRKTLPINNALTRIIRMLGEEENVVGGYLDVTNKLRHHKRLETAQAMIERIAERNGATAPPEVQGLLEVIRQTRIVDWKDRDWRNLEANIDAYYRAGFKTLTYRLFEYFAAHKNEAGVIRKMREDIAASLGSVAWGDFKGFSEDFRKRYGLTTEDELALLREYMSAYNFTYRDYAEKYEDIKAALDARGEEWRTEVDDELRTLFRMGGTKGMIIYDPDKSQVLDRPGFHDRLSRYAQTEKTFRAQDADARLKKALSDYVSSPDDAGVKAKLKNAAVLFTINRSQLNADTYKNVPFDDETVREDDVKTYRWISDWRALLKDAYRGDAAPAIEQAADEIVNQVKPRSIDKIFAAHNVSVSSRRISIKEKKTLFKEDNDMLNVLADPRLAPDQRSNALADLFARKWMSQIDGADVRNRQAFGEWVGRGIDRFVNRLAGKAAEKQTDLPMTVTDIKDLVKRALESARAREEGQLAERDSEDLKRNQEALKKKIKSAVLDIFAEDVIEIDREISGFKTIQVGTSENFQVGFFDDLLHLMGFMLSCVCTWFYRDKQVLDTRYHFGKLAVKDERGRILALSQVQLLRAGIKGGTKKESQKGWRVIALPGINLDRGSIGMDAERAVFSLLEAAQRLAERAGMEGAVVPAQAGIHSNNHRGEQKIIDGFVANGWLKRARLTQSILLNEAGHAAPSYSYQDVYIVKIPKEKFTLETSSLEARVEKAEAAAERVAKERSLIFDEGLGEIVYEESASAGRVAASLQTAVNKALSTFPPSVVESIQLSASIRNVSFRVRHDAGLAESHVGQSNGEIELAAGGDIIFDGDKVDTVKLNEMLAEMLVAFVVGNYSELKQASAFNENAYFKLENLKALINHRNYLDQYHKIVNKFNWPAAREAVTDNPGEADAYRAKHKADLDRFTQGVKNISQWNLFLNVMDDADPDFMVSNFIHVMTRDGNLTDENVARLVTDLSGMDINGRTSLAGMRNLFKEFVLPGKAHLLIGEQTVTKDKFGHFDRSEDLVQKKNELLTTRSRDVFYRTLNEVLANSLPLKEEERRSEISRLVDNKLFEDGQREEAVRKAIEEILVRKFGGRAFTSVKEHLSGQRGTKTIPYFNVSDLELSEGDDPDKFGFLQYASADDVNYELVFEGVEGHAEAPEKEPEDWVHKLFPSGVSERAEDEAGFGVETSLERKTVLYVRGAEHLALIMKSSRTRGFRLTLPRDVNVVLQDDNAGPRGLDALRKTALSIGKSLKLKREQVWIGKRLDATAERWLLTGQIIYVGPDDLPVRFAQSVIANNHAWNAFFEALVKGRAMFERSA